MPSNFTLKRDENVFVKEQTAWGTIAWPAAADAIKALTISIQGAEERPSREDLRATRSVGKTLRGKRSCTWSMTGYIIPSGSLGTPPDIGPILKHGFGVETISGGTSVTYSLLKDVESTLNGLSITKFGNHFAQTAMDATVNELTLKGAGGEIATFEASGDASDEVYTGSSLVATSAGAGSATVTVTAGEGVMFSVNSTVKVNGVGGHRVTGISGDVLTVSPSVSASQTAGQTVVPDEPSTTTTGDAIHGISGSYSLDGGAVTIISGMAKIANNFEMRNNEYGVTVASGFSGGTREVTHETELHLTKANFKHFGRAQTLVQSDIQLIVGSVAGKRMQIDMNKTESDIPAVEIPDTGETSVTLAGKAVPTATEDEISAVFN